MKLADRSPGLTIVLAAVVVYGTILVEIGMWMVASWFAMFATLGLAIVLAVVVCQWLFGLLGDEESAEAVPAPAPVPVAAAAPARERRRSAPRRTAVPA